MRGVVVFLAVLVLTISSITGLRYVSKQVELKKQHTQAVEVVEAEETQPISAVIREEKQFPFASVGAFLLILVAMGAGVHLLRRHLVENPKAQKREGRRYNPDSEIAFRTVVFEQGQSGRRRNR